MQLVHSTCFAKLWISEKAEKSERQYKFSFPEDLGPFFAHLPFYELCVFPFISLNHTH